MADSHIRVIKHDSPTQRKVLLYIGAILIALLIGAVLLLILGVNPLSYYGKMITMGMPGNAIAYKNFENYLKVFVPLLVTSLALALGLSDEIQSAAGGIRLDTLFLDEGFGSLDDESLEQAIRVLAGLTEGDRLVGIISHVAALKERIDKQVVVKKARSGGSTVEVLV